MSFILLHKMWRVWWPDFFRTFTMQNVHQRRRKMIKEIWITYAHSHSVYFTIQCHWIKAQHITMQHSTQWSILFRMFQSPTRLFRTVHHVLMERYALSHFSDVFLCLRHFHSCTKHAWAASYSVPYHLVIVNCTIF